jgi:hypothetical protein
MGAIEVFSDFVTTYQFADEIRGDGQLRTREPNKQKTAAHRSPPFPPCLALCATDYALLGIGSQLGRACSDKPQHPIGVSGSI